MKTSAKVWPLNQILRMYQKETITFSNIYQRSYTWDKARECGLMASLIEGYNIPPFICNRHCTEEDGSIVKNPVYDLLNGKQRILCLAKITNTVLKDNEKEKAPYKFAGVRELTLEPDDAITFTQAEKEILSYYVGEDGREHIDINDLSFNEFPEVLREIVMSRMLRFEYYDDLTSEEERRIIINANDGKPMNTAEKNRVEMISFATFLRIAKHPVFKEALTDKAIAGYWNEKLSEQSYMMLYCSEPEFNNKAFKPYIINVEVTKEQEAELNSVFDRILNIYNIMKVQKAKVAKRILGKLHFTSLVPIIKDSIEKEVTAEDMAKWLLEFFNGDKKATIDDIYNENATTATSGKKQIAARVEALMRSYNAYVLNGEEIKTENITEKENIVEEDTQKETVETEVVSTEVVNEEFKEEPKEIPLMSAAEFFNYAEKIMEEE